MTTRLGPLVDDMVRTMYDGDQAGFRRASGRVWTEAQSCDPDELTAAVEQIAPRLGGIYGTFAKVAVLAGALVEFGASPLSLCEVLPNRAITAMSLFELFPRAWKQVSGGEPLPDRADLSEMGRVREAFAEDAKRRGISAGGADAIAFSWFDVDDWVSPMLTVMAQRRFRDAMSTDHRDELRAAAEAVAGEIDGADWLHGLSLVLDDEPLIVLDPASGRGFRLTISGVGDNFQLHTLIADKVIGAPEDGLIAGLPPEPAWVAAATDGVHGPFDPPAAICRRFRLFDGRGGYVSPEGRPCDIEPLDGTRVVVLHPPLGNYGWQFGRSYEHMAPTVTLDRVLEPAEAARLLSRIAPARETDLMAINRDRIG